jgi:DNA-binding NarL/FixJ family response regulator
VNTQVRVVVVDDEPMVCEFLRSSLTGDQLAVVAVAHDGAEGVEAVLRNDPDVVLMDLRMPGVDGVRATREIRALPNAPAVLAMTTLDTDEHVLSALDAGAAGFILKTTAPDQLVRVVLAAAGGSSVLSPQALAHLRDRGRAPATDPRVAALPERDREVLDLVADGLSNAEIAQHLYLSEGTVKGSVSRLMTQLDCQNRTQLALRVIGRRA